MKLLLSCACLGILLTAAVQVDAFTTVPSRVVSRRLLRTTATTSTSTASTTSHFLASKSSVIDTTVQWGTIKDVKVQTLDGKTVEMGSVVPKDDATIILSCLSHFGDFNAWELTQQYLSALESGQITSNSPIVLVGIGSVRSAQKFAQDLGLEKYSDRITLLADEKGAVSEALGCYRGWLVMDQQHKERYPQSDINPYFKLLGMIFGFGSPGTIGQVLYGYLGDAQGSNGPDGRKWVVDSLLQGSDKGRFPKLTKTAFANTPALSPLRPFELATLRLQTGLHIVSQWGKLGPKNGDLFTRMGGTFVFSPQQQQDSSVWSFFDQGILGYANVEEVSRVVQATLRGQVYVPLTREERAAMKKAREEALLQQQQEENRRLLEESARSVVQAAEEAKSPPPSVEKGAVPMFFAERTQQKEETMEDAAAIARFQAAEEAIRQADERARVVSKLLETVAVAVPSPAVRQQQQVMELPEVTRQEWQETTAPLTTMEEKEEDSDDLLEDIQAEPTTELSVPVDDMQVSEEPSPELPVQADYIPAATELPEVMRQEWQETMAPLPAMEEKEEDSDDWVEDIQAEPTTELSVPVDDIQASEEPSPELPVQADYNPAATEEPSTELPVPSSSATIITLPLDDAIGKARERFYRTLLAARFKYDQAAKTAAKSAEAGKTRALFYRTLSEARFKYDQTSKTAAKSAEAAKSKEAFQRKLLAAKFNYDRSGRVVAPPKADEEVAVRLQAADEARQNAVEATNQLQEAVAKFEEEKDARLVADEATTIVQALDEAEPEIPLQDNAAIRPTNFEAAKNKELFQRKLLERKLSYLKFKYPLASKTEPVVEASAPSATIINLAETMKEEPNGDDSLRQKETFQRQLLAARFQLEKTKKALFQSQELSLSAVDDSVAPAVPEPSDDEDAPSPKMKELFQRQLLQARFQLEQAKKSEPEEEEEVANADTYGRGFQKSTKKQGKKSKSRKN